MTKILKDERGITLILTIVIITIIVALTLQFQKAVMSELHSATGFKNNVKLGSLAKSGVDCAMGVLAWDGMDNSFDSLHDVWADPLILAMFSSSLFDDGGFEIKINDLSGKIRINHLTELDVDNVDNKKWVFDSDTRELVTRLLQSEVFELEDNEIDDILDAIKDWIDQDDITTGFGGAESYYYESLDQPYTCRNAPLESIEELSLIKGITKDLMNGTETRPGLAAFFTVHGSDQKININTADTLVLNSLFGIPTELSEELVAYRDNEDNNLNNSTWYRNVLDEDLLDPVNTSLVSTSSNHFKIESIGVMDPWTKRIKVTIKRVNKEIEILSWNSQ